MGKIVIEPLLGGTIMPTLPEVSFQRLAWTIRIYGPIFMGSLGLANLLMRRRLTLRNAPGELFNWKVLKPAPLSISVCTVSIPRIGILTDFRSVRCYHECELVNRPLR
ncbi:hypothetical protein BKA70DRAFT_1302323 [Coprinopsis sp. MPI-PUGE-AT-0042]|nr:hypothetical protein BKA70DRAFT_1302323 [Coprinopsis sp. MPI-PUGE-AT-0042]